MATEIVLPQWSMGMADSTIVRWLKREGETVMEGEPLVKAAALALKEHPRVNAWLEGESLHLLQDIHIGVAVALDEGLIVPIVRNADQKSLRTITQETTRLAQCAREGSLTREEVTGAHSV